jgi:hypothetical protein
MFALGFTKSSANAGTEMPATIASTEAQRTALDHANFLFEANFIIGS